MNMSLANLLNLRSEYERIVNDRRSRFDLPSYEGDISSLEWFVENGYKSNRFRKQFNEALQLAKQILAEK